MLSADTPARGLRLSPAQVEHVFWFCFFQFLRLLHIQAYSGGLCTKHVQTISACHHPRKSVYNHHFWSIYIILGVISNPEMIESPQEDVSGINANSSPLI